MTGVAKDKARGTMRFRNAVPALQGAARVIDGIDNGLEFPELHDLADAAVSAMRGKMLKGDYKRHIHDGLNLLEVMAKKHPDSRYEITKAATLLVAAVLQQGAWIATGEFLRITGHLPLLKINASKAAAVERAQVIATELWQADTAQEIRLGDMAERVYRALAAEDFTEALPGTAERVKEWIKPVAPDYARKGGRRRKTP